MEDCEYLEGCPVFARFRVEGAKNFWIRLYCQGLKQEECERRKLANVGELVPETLLPNGKHLEVFT
jgi:hypothetical protein